MKHISPTKTPMQYTKSTIQPPEIKSNPENSEKRLKISRPNENKITEKEMFKRSVTSRIA